MKKLNTLLSILVFTTLVLPSSSMADAKKGHRIYKKKLQRSCKIAGSIFAREHSQDEWEKINEEKRFKEETLKICPKLDLNTLNEKQWKDLYDFSYQFGIGGEIPNGCDPK